MLYPAELHARKDLALPSITWWLFWWLLASGCHGDFCLLGTPPDGCHQHRPRPALGFSGQGLDPGALIFGSQMRVTQHHVDAAMAEIFHHRLQGTPFMTRREAKVWRRSW